MANNSPQKESSPRKKRRSSTRRKSQEKQALLRLQAIEELRKGVPAEKVAKSVGISRSLAYSLKAELKAANVAPTTTAEQLPFYALKASDPWKPNAFKNETLFEMPCVACKQVMWTDSKKNDLCESCMYQAMTDAAEATIQREAPRFINSFGDAMPDTRERAALRGKL